MSGIIAVGYFLINLFFGLALFALWARMFLRFYKISPLHPISKMINTFTDPVVKPLDRFMTSKKISSKRYDWACFAVIIIVEVIKFILLGLLFYHAIIPLFYLLLFVIVDLIVQPCDLLFYIILIRVIMSWVNPSWKHPAGEVMKKVTDPLLALGRYIIPEVSGFDFSPLVVLVFLKVITLFLSASLPLRL